MYGEQTKEFKTARTYPKMVLINVSLDGTDAVKLSAPDMPELRVKIPQPSENNKHERCTYVTIEALDAFNVIILLNSASLSFYCFLTFILSLFSSLFFQSSSTVLIRGVSLCLI